MQIGKVWRKADTLRGCLAPRRTALGRRRHATDEDPLFVPDFFASDEAKILESKAHRVLCDKTQVFSFPESSLVRRRSTHVNEVVAVSVIASELLGLNTNLVRAGAQGHDIGHTPFGHQGEHWLSKAMGRPEFCHEVMGPIIAQKIERKGKGLNLTWETLEAMLCHSGKKAHPGMSQEAWLLRYTDKIAYLFHDFNDIVVRMRYPVRSELRELVAEFGDTQRERTTTAIAGLVIESAERGGVSFEGSELGRKFQRLRELMYRVYPHVTEQEIERAADAVLNRITLLDVGDPFLIFALMTDRDARIVAETVMMDMHVFNRTAVSEIVPHLPAIGAIDLCDPGMDWNADRQPAYQSQ